MLAFLKCLMSGTCWKTGPWDVGNEQKADEQDKREKWNMYFGHIKRHPY